MPSPRAHHTVGRVDAILDLVARAPEPPTLTGITTALGLPRSTVADLLRELREQGYVRRTGRRYRARVPRARARPARRGGRADPLRTAAGRLLLACADEAERAVALRAALGDGDDAAAVAAFERERPAIEHAGAARSDGVADPGVRALAVPVVEDGAVVAARGLFAPRRRPDLAPGEHDPALEQAARRVLGRLAGT